MTKIGRRELEIVDYLSQRGWATWVQILADFSPTIEVHGKTYSQYSIVRDRLSRMLKKGLISVERQGPERIVRLAV